jgi:peptidoglycan/xylan/chitin deacetylase (PgdA/CDA1 family)
MFLKRHYKIIPLSQLEETRSGNSLPANSLIITFDDGYEDNFTTAYPILLRNKVPFSIFLVSDWVKNQGVPWWDDLYYRLRKIQGINLSEGKPRLNQLGVWLAAQFERDPSKLFSVLGTWEWDQIKKALESLNSFEESTSALQHHNRPLTWEMAKEMQGLGEFGSHGCFHQALTRIDLTEVRKHAVLSKREIERNLEKPVMAFCYPSGKWSIPVKKIISESGYPYAVTQDKGINNLRDKHALKRINIWEGTGNVGSGKFSEALFAFRLSGF